MVKDDNEVIKEFNEIVNMTASELEKWLKSNDSQSAGWSKSDGGGESVGHDSGRRIIEILKSNPNKDPKKYTDEQVQHMRKVAAYCKRHLAQEKKMINEKSTEEVKKSKSYASLKNWGHDPLKESEGDEAEDEDEDSGGDEGQQVGEKRKAGKNQTRESKRRETRKGKGSKKATNEGAKKQKQASDEDADDGEEEEEGEKEDDASDDENEKEDEEKQEEVEDASEDEKENGGDQQPNKGPQVGDEVSWNWGAGQPKGKVLDVKGEKTSITTKRGNEVSRDGNPEDPAVVLDTGKSKAIKSNHELN